MNIPSLSEMYAKKTMAADMEGVDPMALPVRQPDVLRDLYRPMQSGDWALQSIPTIVCRGYWTGMQIVEWLVVLIQNNSTWMSLTPMEIESQQIGVEYARGHVVILGMGMGWSAAMSALHTEVEKVTIVEIDDDVLAMHRELDLFARLPDGAGDKVEIVQADAFKWKPDSHVDLMMPDIWLDFVSEDRPAEVRQMQDNIGADMVYFWGQELELARCAIAAGRDIDDAGLAATAEEFKLPLVGLDSPDYAERTRIGAREWMLGRWHLEGEVPQDLQRAEVPTKGVL